MASALPQEPAPITEMAFASVFLPTNVSVLSPRMILYHFGYYRLLFFLIHYKVHQNLLVAI